MTISLQKHPGFPHPIIIIGLLIMFWCTKSVSSQNVTINTVVPPSITVCQEPDTFQVAIINETQSPLTSPQITIEFPLGVSYVSGTLQESTSQNLQVANISNLQHPVFSANTIVAGDSLKFSVVFEASIPAVDYLLQGNLFRNKVKINYGGYLVTAQSNTYNLLYAALNIVGVSPTSKSLNSGDTYNRSISVVNAGYGKLSEFYLTESQNNTGLEVLSSNFGSLNATKDTLFLSGADFTSIGNGDDYFDSNEGINVVYTLQGSGCQNQTVTSSLQAHWGCEGQVRSTSASYAHATISYNAPNLNTSATAYLNPCFDPGTGSEQKLVITNSGQGPATSIVLDLYKSSNNGYDEDIFSRIDAGSFQYKIGNGSYQSISPYGTIATRNDNGYGCLGSNPIGRVLMNLPQLPAGESLTLKWDMYHCAINVCLQEKVMGWKYQVDYADTCNLNTYSKSGTGQSVNNENLSVFTETPSDINDGEVKTFDYTISSFSNELPEGTGAFYELIFKLPVGLAFNNSNSNLMFNSGPNTWAASSLVYDPGQHTITAQYPLPAPFLLPKAEISLKLEGDCSMPGTNSGTKEVELNINYIPDNSCLSGFKIPFLCDFKVDVDLHCPLSGPCEGMEFFNYDISRTSTGAPDNNQDGLPDGSGSLDEQKIKRNRVMVGDTLRGVFGGVVNTSINHPQWSFGYASSSIELGTNLTAISATVQVYDASQNQYLSCSQVPISSQISGNDQTFSFDFSPTTLAGACSSFSGFQYEIGDSIWLSTDYKVTGNIGGAVQEVKTTNDFYLSDVQNPTQSSDKYQCGFYNDKFTLIGYYFANAWTNNYTVKKCTRVVSQNYWMSIGDCCSNYNGGDLFPYEYRNWAHVKLAKVVIPPNYTLVNCYTRQQRTRYVNSSITETVNPIVPDNQSGTTLYFDLEQYYQPHGGSIYYSDDGFQGTLYLELAPTCDVPTNTWEDISWEFTFKESDILSGAETSWYTANPDRIRFTPTNLDLSSTNPVIDGLEKTVIWNLKVKNSTSNTDASNAWIHIQAPSGDLEIIEVVDVATGQAITLTGDIYQVGSINRNQSKNYQIKARYGACNVDKLWVYSGYECSGYPASFYGFTCPYSVMELRVEPKPAGLQAVIDGSTLGGECGQTVEVTVEVASVKLAIADSIRVKLTLPQTGSLTYQSGNSEFKYPISSNFSGITDPVQNGSELDFHIVDYNNTIQSQGLPGVLNLDSNKFQLRFQLKVESNFQPGDFALVSIDGQEACGTQLSTINLAYDPSVKFEKNLTSGLSNDSKNNWSAAWVDYNNDGFEDVFVTNYDKQQHNILYKNNGDGTFIQATNAGALVSDLTNAVSSTWGDFDNDGNIDVFISNNTGADNALYRNAGNGIFTKVTTGDIASYGGYCHNAAWADYDNDGHLDLFVTEYMPTRFNLLYHNNGDGTFTQTTQSALSLEAKYSIGATWCDYDNDGDLDLYVPNTNNAPNSLYTNEGNGVFTKVTSGAIVTDSANSVGCSWGDYNNDGYMDLFVANSGNQVNNLYQNLGNGSFAKVTSGIVVTETGNSHGSAWADMDNDGDLDLMVTNDQNGTNSLYTNNGDGTFSKFENVINTDVANSFGTAWGDYDNDGDLDLLVANHGNQANDFYTNSKGSCNSWTCFQLTGTQSNKSAIGARVRVKASIYGSPTWQMREVSSQTGGGAGGQNTLKAMFGLGDASSIDSVIINWPSGMVQYLTNVSVNNCMSITEESGNLVSGKAYHDVNGNCSYDSGELLMANTTVAIQPGPRYVTTDDDGNYSTYLEAGNYTLQAQPNSGWDNNCNSVPVEHQVAVSGTPGETHTGLDFPLKSFANQPDLTVSIGIGTLRRGLRNLLVITYENLGGGVAENAVLQLELPSELIAVSTDVPWNNVSGNIYEWNLGSIPINGSGVIHLEDSVSVAATLGEVKVITTTISTSTNETDYSNNQASGSDEIVGSVDPNDKQVFPQGYGPSGLINRNDTLTYKIRFQNVGTYKAWRVFVIDTLSKHLDFTTIHNVVMSHEGNFTVFENGILKFEFIGIELPDSLSDEPNSHGFVQFQILPKEDAPEYATILNRASIQFDYNEFIQTNTVINTVVNRIEEKDLFVLFLYPNPTRGMTTVEILARDRQRLPIEFEEIRIYQTSGNLQRVYENINSTRFSFDSSDLAKGMYFVKARDEYGYWYHAQLVVF